MINIAEILKDCPKGTKLYSPICGECRLIKIYDGLGFDVINDTDDVFNFSYDGRYNLNGECCIFPSKENRDWNKFRPFKDGDIIYKPDIQAISILKSNDSEKTISYVFLNISNILYTDYRHNSDLSYWRIATEEEENRLFDAIKANGYKWNAETKTLEKLIVPKFKAGDKIKEKNERFPSTRTIDNYVEGIGYYTTIHDWVRIEDQDNWELLVITPKFKVGDEIVKKNSITNSYIVNSVSSEYYGLTLPNRTGIAVLNVYEQDDWELVSNKFDMSTLKAYDKVLVRDTNVQVWVADLFSHVLDRPLGGYTFACVGHYPNQCIPYLGNQHLLGTCDDCDEYYKNW